MRVRWIRSVGEGVTIGRSEGCRGAPRKKGKEGSKYSFCLDAVRGINYNAELCNDTTTRMC